MFFKILDVNQTWYMYMWWWKSADILHEHNLSTPHCANWRFIDYAIWLIKIYFYKGYKTIYYKLWEKSGFHASSPWIIDLGPTHVTQVARSTCRIEWASRSTLDLLTVHFKEQKETWRNVHGSLRFFWRILFTELAVLIVTNKVLLNTISWHWYHAINKSKMPWN